ncbi:MAG: hypothetical protein M1823_002058 [Watsoniomyces obsoletus]|nr:MAG: hypothetical protein M1823_002058 [Watsoniomyces obsoletus]
MANATGHYIAPVTAYDDYGRPLFVAEHDDDIQYLSDSTGSRSSSISRLSLRGFLASDEVAVNGVGADGVASDGVGQIKKKDHSKEAHHHHQQGNLRRYLSFGCAILSCLCAGSITAFSLYGHLFLSKLHYTQYEVNSVSIAAELAMYLPVPFVGYLCDRYNPGAISGLSSILFGLGYSLAAFTYLAGPPIEAGGTGWPVAMMILAFIGIGSGTSSMYISAVTTCAKNFGSGRLRGLALAVPIAAFGLSGMWQSQVGSRYFGIQDPDTGRDTLDVFKFFLFLSVLLFVVGIIGIFGLQVIDEEILIDEAVEELERSGLLEDSAFFRNGSTQQQSYGTIAQGDSMDDEDDDDEVTPTLTRTQSYVDGQRKKTWLLNAETRIFLADHTMWWFAGGFFLVTGPGEAFINNLGTIIGTLTPPSAEESYAPTTAATHVSIVAISSTLARILTGLLSDMLAPPAKSSLHPERFNNTLNDSGWSPH